MNTDTKQAPQLPQTDVKSRFFAQYWGQKVMKKNIEGLENFYSEPDGFIRSMTKDSPLFLELKPLSEITDEDAQHIMQLEAFIDWFLSHDFLEFLIDLKKGNCNRFEVVDFLRSQGYALPFMECSVEDLISFGWVQLL